MNDSSPYSQPKPPKTITKVQDNQYYDFRSLYTWIFLFMVGSVLYLIQKASNAIGMYRIDYFILLLLIVFIWIKYLSSPEKVEKQKQRALFLYDEARGKHTINLFTVPVNFLEKIVPIVGVHKGGIIEFRGRIFGVLMETYPYRISEDERPRHERRIEKVINGIPANTHFKTVACSRLEPRKPILKYLMDLSSRSKGDRATELHLSGLYTKIAEDNSDVISWKYYAFLSLGPQKSLEAARIQYGAVVPGLLKNMRAAGLRPRVYETDKEIVTAYRTFFSELVIK